MGDSIARLVCLALFALLETPSSPAPPVVKHGDMRYMSAGGLEVSFLWRPYAANATAQLLQWRDASTACDVLVLGVGLWHALHVADAGVYERALHALMDAWHAWQRHLVRRSKLRGHLGCCAKGPCRWRRGMSESS